MCTYKRPGLNKASSIKSILFVIPITRILFGDYIPSIKVKSWLTKVSPAVELLFPLFLLSESI